MECAESYVNLESTGVVELDTAVVPDVLGLRAHYEDAKPTRVLPGRARNSVQILVPNTNATPRGFHDITLVDMTGVSVPTVSMGEVSNLRRQWPTSLLMGMTRRQTNLDLKRRECKHRFRDPQQERCSYCGCSYCRCRGVHIDHIRHGHHVVPAMDSDAISVECGVEAECVVILPP